MTRFLNNGRIAGLARTLIAASALSCGCSSLSAAIVEDLYSVTVTRSLELAPGQSPRTQEEEIRFAMGQLLTRVTGRVDAPLEPNLADMLQNATDFVVQIGSLDRQTLLVTFDARAIEGALVAREQPIWGPERPLTLLWLAIDTGQGERGILSADDASTDISPAFIEMQAEYRRVLAAVADDRGLPLALPLLDLEDMNSLSFVDIWAGFNDQVNRASQRYGADAVLSGRARVTRFGVNVQWTLLKDGEQFALGGSSMRDGLDRLADFFAAEFSTLGGLRATPLTITGVDSLDDYGRVMRYLESLSLIDTVATEELVDGALALRVDARGGAVVLGRVLELGRTLSPVNTQPDTAAADDRLTLTLNP